MRNLMNFRLRMFSERLGASWSQQSPFYIKNVRYATNPVTRSPNIKGPQHCDSILLSGPDFMFETVWYVSEPELIGINNLEAKKYHLWTHGTHKSRYTSHITSYKAPIDRIRPKPDLERISHGWIVWGWCRACRAPLTLQNGADIVLTPPHCACLGLLQIWEVLKKSGELYVR